MQTELIKEFIGEKCVISLMTGTAEFIGVIKEVESYWIKIQEEDSLRLINGVAIRDIKILKDK